MYTVKVVVVFKYSLSTIYQYQVISKLLQIIPAFDPFCIKKRKERRSKASLTHTKTDRYQIKYWYCYHSHGYWYWYWHHNTQPYLWLGEKCMVLWKNAFG